MAVVLVVIEDPLLRDAVRRFGVSDAFNERVRTPHVIIAELTGRADCKGVEAVRHVRSTSALTPVIAISRTDSAAVTQQAVRLRVNDFFRLPDEGLAFKTAVTALLERPCSIDQHALLGDSPQMAGLRSYIAKVALTDSSVLITGETGTGKELVAGLIHKSGSRGLKPFVCVNSAALPDLLLESELFGYEKGAFTGAHASYPGRLRMAHGGTIFFDEIGDLSLSSQAKVLRALESREVQPLGGWRSVGIDVRLVAATHQDLDVMLRSGGFRKDLYYRLNVVRIEVPPLRSRKEDIPRLLDHFVDVFNAQLQRHVESFEADAVALLQTYDWPGNIRELRNVVEVSFVNTTGDRITVADLPKHLWRSSDVPPEPDTREHLIRALLSSNWNITRTADVLQCSRMTVYRKMAQYQISR